LIDPITASSNQKQRVATVVTHELAHQWFGNLVTMQWWDDLWLNEGFASWAENWAADLLYPDYAMWDQFTTGHLSSALRLDALKSSHPIQVPIHHAEEVEQVFDAISYCKGGSVVRMIKAVLGTKNFQTGLANYMKKYAYGNTETVDLWTAWEDVSQMPVNEMMASWTEQMGFPILKVVKEDWKEDNVTLQLDQFWFLADGASLDEESASKRWTIPILTCTTDGIGSDMTLMRDKTATITLTFKAKDSWVKLNAGQEVPMRVCHSADMLQRLSGGIKSKTLSAIDRAGLINDAYALVKAGHQSPESLIRLLGNYIDEDEYIVWQGLADALSGLYALLSDSDEVCAKFEAFAKKMVVNLMTKIGWEVQKTDGHLTTLLRGIMIGLIGTFAYDDEAVLNEAKTRFAAFQADPKDVQSLPSDMRSAVFTIILKNGGVKEYDEIKSYFYTADNTAEKKHVLNSIGSIPDPKLKLATMEWSISGDIKLQDFFYAMGSVGRSKRVGREIAWKFFQDNFVKIKGMIEKASSSLMDACIVMCAGGFCTNDKADEIDAFFAGNPVPSSTRKIAQLTESMRANAKFLSLILASELSNTDFWEKLM
jgi:puromycin-sensitive aminopeptidase